MQLLLEGSWGVGRWCLFPSGERQCYTHLKKFFFQNLLNNHQSDYFGIYQTKIILVILETCPGSISHSKTKGGNQWVSFWIISAVYYSTINKKNLAHMVSTENIYYSSRPMCVLYDSYFTPALSALSPVSTSPVNLIICSLHSTSHHHPSISPLPTSTTNPLRMHSGSPSCPEVCKPVCACAFKSVYADGWCG